MQDSVNKEVALMLIQELVGEINKAVTVIEKR